MDVIQNPPVLSVEQVRHRFYASGTSVTDWAHKHGFSRQVVYSLLSGRTRGYRGTAHAAAVALGLKAEMDISELEPVRSSVSAPHVRGTAGPTTPSEDLAMIS